MGRQVLNTVIKSTAGSVGPGPGPGGDKFIFWGHINKTSGITVQDVLALNQEERPDRFKDFIDFDSGGEHMIIVFPVQYGGDGKFLDDASQFTYPFTLSGTITLMDPNNNSYDVNIYTWSRKSYGIIAKLKTL